MSHKIGAERLERTRHERTSLLSCAGEPLKRNVRRLRLDVSAQLFV